MLSARAAVANPCLRRSILYQLYFRSYSSPSEGPNHAIIQMLKRNKEEEEQNTDKNNYKIRAFVTAIKAIGQLDHPIRSLAEAKTLKGVGPGITRRISEFLDASDHVPTASPPPEVLEREALARRAREHLELIPGIGTVKARQLVQAGCMSISDLRRSQFLSLLSKPQQIGVKYFEHIEVPVQRSEAEAVTQFIRDNLSSKYEIILGGSYRRGSPTSSDIDILILHPDNVYVPFPNIPSPLSSSSSLAASAARLNKNVAFRGTGTSSNAAARATSLLLQEVVPTLQERGLLAATLSSGVRKWQGFVRIPDADGLEENGDRRAEWQRRISAIEANEGSYRRMDLNLVPMKSRGAALLALTGDTDFNRDIRMKAIKLGMHLNEFGLWRWNPSSTPPPSTTGSKSTPKKTELKSKSKEIDPDPEKEEDEDLESADMGLDSNNGFWELVRVDTEEEILRELGMDYVEPTKRNFSFVLGKTRMSKTKRT